jgi:hypothetical protein
MVSNTFIWLAWVNLSFPSIYNNFLECAGIFPLCENINFRIGRLNYEKELSLLYFYFAVAKM